MDDDDDDGQIISLRSQCSCTLYYEGHMIQALDERYEALGFPAIAPDTVSIYLTFHLPTKHRLALRTHVQIANHDGKGSFDRANRARTQKIDQFPLRALPLPE